MTTPNLELPEVPQAIEDASDELNTGFRKLDAVVHLSVLGKDLATPPENAAQGVRYIVAAPATGVWINRERRIAYKTVSGWSFVTPREGWFAWVTDEQKLYRYQQSTSTWVEYLPAPPEFSGAVVTRNAAQSIPNNTTTQVIWNTETFDTDGYHDSSTNPTRLLVPEDGTYILGANLDWAGGGSSGNRIGWVTKNGATSIPCNVTLAASIDLRYNMTSPPQQCIAGDYFELNVFQTSGGARNLSIDSSALAFWIMRIQPGAGGAGGGSSGIVESIVAGTNITVDDADPANPVVSASGGSGVVESIVAGSNITVDGSDPANPIVSATGGGGSGVVESIVAGTNITVDDTDPANPIVSASGGVAVVPEYSDPAYQWYGASGVIVASTSSQISGDPCVVQDGAQWVLFHFTTVSGAPHIRTYYRTAPTLEGPWSSATEISNLAGYGKLVVLVDEYGTPVQVGGLYHGYVISYDGTVNNTEIYHVSAPMLTGTWTLGSKVIAKGASGSKDEKQTNAPGVVYKDGTVYLWYMGVPASPLTTFGLGARKLRATASDPDGPFVKDYTDVIDLSTTPGDWNYGYHGGTQVLRRPASGYIMVLNCGDTRPVTAGTEPDGSRMGYAYSNSIDGPWTYDRANPTHKFDNTPSDALEKANIWKGYIAYDSSLKRWYLFYNTNTTTEIITFAREGTYRYRNAPGGGSSYNIQVVTTTQTAIAGSRVNLIPGVYRVRLLVNYTADSGGAIRALGITTQLRVNGVDTGVPSLAFVGSYAFENDDFLVDEIVNLTSSGYIDFTADVTSGTPSPTLTLARKLRVDVERL